MGWSKRENIRVDQEWQQSVRIEKCATKQIKNKWVERRTNVCDETVRNWVNEMWFTSKKFQGKTSTNKKMRLKWVREKKIMECEQLDENDIQGLW